MDLGVAHHHLHPNSSHMFGTTAHLFEDETTATTMRTTLSQTHLPNLEEQTATT